MHFCTEFQLAALPQKKKKKKNFNVLALRYQERGKHSSGMTHSVLIL